MDKCGANQGHVVIFDWSKTSTWEEKVFCCQEEYQGHPTTVWGM